MATIESPLPWLLTRMATPPSKPHSTILASTPLLAETQLTLLLLVGWVVVVVMLLLLLLVKPAILRRMRRAQHASRLKFRGATIAATTTTTDKILTRLQFLLLATLENELHLLDVLDDQVEGVLHALQDDIAIVIGAVLPQCVHERGVDLFELLE